MKVCFCLHLQEVNKNCNEPKYIATLIQKYPYFKPLYDDLYEMCLNTEGVMNMFSKELQIADHNTVTYMIDEMKAEIDAKDREIDAKDREIAEKDAAIADKDATYAAAIADKETLSRNLCKSFLLI